MNELGNIVTVRNIKINGKKVAKRECLIIAEEQNKYYMLPFVSNDKKSKFDYNANNVIAGKSISLGNLVVINKDEPKELIGKLDIKEYMITLFKLNNQQLIDGDYSYPFFAIKRNIQGQIIDYQFDTPNETDTSKVVK